MAWRIIRATMSSQQGAQESVTRMTLQEMLSGVIWMWQQREVRWQQKSVTYTIPVKQIPLPVWDTDGDSAANRNWKRAESKIIRMCISMKTEQNIISIKIPMMVISWKMRMGWDWRSQWRQVLNMTVIARWKQKIKWSIYSDRTDFYDSSKIWTEIPWNTSMVRIQRETSWHMLRMRQGER